MSPEPSAFTPYGAMIGASFLMLRAAADDVLGAGLLSVLALGVQPFGVVREALVDPHVGLVLRRDVVAPPLVRALVDDDEVPLHSPAGARQVAPASSRSCTGCRTRRRSGAPCRGAAPRSACSRPCTTGTGRTSARSTSSSASPAGTAPAPCRGDRRAARSPSSACRFSPLIRIGEVRVLPGVHLDVVVVDRLRRRTTRRSSCRRRCGRVLRRRPFDTSIIGSGTVIATRWLSGSSAQHVLVRPPDAGAESFVGRRDPAVARGCRAAR